MKNLRNLYKNSLHRPISYTIMDKKNLRKNGKETSHEF